MGKDESAPYPLILIRPMVSSKQTWDSSGEPILPRSYQALAAGGAGSGGRRQEVRAGDPGQWLQHEARH
jgi:hypothetical protein